MGNLELVWHGGIRPTEEKDDEDVQYGSGMISQAGEIDDVQTKGPDKDISRQVYKGKTEWVAVRTKYFMSALLVGDVGEEGHYAVLSAENVVFGTRKHTPLYSAAIGYPLDVSSVSSNIYLGPLDVDHVAAVGAACAAPLLGLAVPGPSVCDAVRL